MHAYIGRVQVVADRYVIVWRHEETVAVDMHQLPEREDEVWVSEDDELERLVWERMAWGGVIPDRCPVPIIYKNWDENEYSSIEQQNYDMEVRP